MTTITLPDKNVITITLSSSTAAPDAPRGTIAGQAFTTWYRINDEPWMSLGLGLHVENASNLAKSVQNVAEFVRLVETL